MRSSYGRSVVCVFLLAASVLVSLAGSSYERRYRRDDKPNCTSRKKTELEETLPVPRVTVFSAPKPKSSRPTAFGLSERGQAQLIESLRSQADSASALLSHLGTPIIPPKKKESFVDESIIRRR